MDNDAISIFIGEVVEVETDLSINGRDCARVRAKIKSDSSTTKKVPWAFPLLPKVFQSIPNEGEAVIVLAVNDGAKRLGQRYYIGPLISQPQFFRHTNRRIIDGLLTGAYKDNLFGKILDKNEVNGAFPRPTDVAVIGRGKEDIILRSEGDESEIDLRAGIRGEPINSDDPNLVGDVIFNGTDPAYIQLKYKKGMASKGKNAGNSFINIVANRINIMSNRDGNISHNLGDNETLVSEIKMDDIMDKLHPVPKGDILVKFLNDIKYALLNHIHPWPGKKQCGDWGNHINELKDDKMEEILSEYVRIS